MNEEKDEFSMESVKLMKYDNTDKLYLDHCRMCIKNLGNKRLDIWYLYMYSKTAITRPPLGLILSNWNKEEVLKTGSKKGIVIMSCLNVKFVSKWRFCVHFICLRLYVMQILIPIRHSNVQMFVLFHNFRVYLRGKWIKKYICGHIYCCIWWESAVKVCGCSGE